jgi:hypothetical protein
MTNEMLGMTIKTVRRFLTFIAKERNVVSILSHALTPQGSLGIDSGVRNARSRSTFLWDARPASPGF